MEANLERENRKECRKEKKKSMEKEKMTKKRKLCPSLVISTGGRSPEWRNLLLKVRAPLNKGLSP